MVVETAVVPKQTPRTPGPDDWAADRISYERQRRGWSTAELARRVTAAGCKINQSSVWHIENGQPRRKISAGEAVAFAQVFEITLDELMKPPDAPEKLAVDLDALYIDVVRWDDEGYDVRGRIDALEERYGAMYGQLEGHPLHSAIIKKLGDTREIVPKIVVHRPPRDQDQGTD